MKRAHFSATTLTLLSAIAACGGGGSSNPDASIITQHDAPVTTIDSSTTIDATHTDSGTGIDSALIDGSTTIDAGNGIDAAPVTCTTTVLGAQDIDTVDLANSFISWGGPVTTDLGDGGAASFELEFYDMIEPDLTASLDLTMGNQADYATCAACVRVFSLDGTGALARQYFQSGGTMKLTEDPFTNKNMVGTITNLALTEVTIDSSFHSTMVVGGKCLAVGTVTLNADSVPNAYTCAAATYGDGANCNCMCGTHDPDCDISGAPVVGCTAAAPLCSDTDTCVAPPTCTVTSALGTPTLTGQTANHDSTAGEIVLDGALNADALPDDFELQLWDGYGVFTGTTVAPGTYTISGAETALSTCGICALLAGDVDTSSGTPTPKQAYQANTGTLTLSSTTGTLTGTLTNATFAAFKIDSSMTQVPDGSNCTVSVTSMSFSTTLTEMASLKKTGRLHISKFSNVKGVTTVLDQKAAHAPVGKVKPAKTSR